MYLKRLLYRTSILIGVATLSCLLAQCSIPDNMQVHSNKSLTAEQLEEGFKNPPLSAKSGVYWYFADGNLSKEGLTKDLESMARVGINHALFLEIGGIRGDVHMFSPEWKDHFKHMVEEAKRLDIQLSLGTGPGWAGTGGPWVNAEESMQHLVSSTVFVEGPGIKDVVIPKPAAKNRYYGDFQFTPELRKQWENFYEDVAVLAFPTPPGSEVIDDIVEKSLYDRPPHSSMFGVKQYLPMHASYPDAPGSIINPDEIMDITSWMKPDGTIEGNLPPGKWTIMRFGTRITGAVTSPAPAPGLGFETNKMDTAAIAHHLNHFVGGLLQHIGFEKRTPESSYGGLAMLHFDSWEMGSQNWTPKFREEFTSRRGYDPQPYYPAYSGLIIGSRELTERFLWDLRRTIQELMLEHTDYIREYAHKHGLGLSIEPYDMTPMADLELAATADVPMCEHWSIGYGFNTTFSVAEATSIAHLKGQPVVPAESFTALNDGWDLYPGKLKNQTDWALAAGINRFMFHTFQHQSLPDNLRPGMTMGSIGVHWDRNQTWWEMGKAYHDYLSRSQFLLQQGRTVSDILYLSPEGNPHVFRAPVSAYEEQIQGTGDAYYVTPDARIIRSSEAEFPALLPDKRGYAFDACPPSFLYKASVKDGRVVFPSGAEYRILVLPNMETMTPGILTKIKQLVNDGATIVGMPPKQSPSLQNYPQCDNEVAGLVKDIWGETTVVPPTMEKRSVGKGKVIWGEQILNSLENLYPNYDCTARILSGMNINEDFVSNGDLRYAHRTTDEYDIYFVSNRSGKPVSTNCTFRMDNRIPELWDAVTGEITQIKNYTSKSGQTTIPMKFDIDQSFFVVFVKSPSSIAQKAENFASFHTLQTLDKPWTVSFDPVWGGPAKTTFDKLTDWSTHTDEGIKYYSGTAVYEQTFDMIDKSLDEYYLNLGEVNIMAKVWLNDKEVGTVWTYPWQLNISDYIQPGENKLKIEVVNLWINRLIGDDFHPYDGYTHGRWPEWVVNGTKRPTERYTFTTFNPYNKDTELAKSGLLGPVKILTTNK